MHNNILVESLLGSLAMGCLIIAFSSIFFGDNQCLQNSPLPFLIIVAISFLIILKSGKKHK